MKNILKKMVALALAFGLAGAAKALDTVTNPTQGVGKVGSPWARPELVDKVQRGELKEARVSWWGYDENDSHRFVQAAIDSNAATVTLDRVASVWTVGKSVRGRSCQTLVIPQGVELKAKRGAFKSTGESLLVYAHQRDFTVTGGGTLRMWLTDYTNSTLYAFSEWRMGLDISSCTRATVENLTIEESGGDGIYLGEGVKGVPNRDIVIRNVTCRRNNRQGISVITADGLVIEDCLLEDTCGTAPMAGLDFEPNHWWNRLDNIVLRNVVSRNNRGCGFEFAIWNIRGVSIRLENCRSLGNGKVALFTPAHNLVYGMRGKIEFENCVFDDRDRSFDRFRKYAGDRNAYSLSFKNCQSADPVSGKLGPLPSDLGWSAAPAPKPIDGEQLRAVPWTSSRLHCAKIYDARPGESVRYSSLRSRGSADYLFYAASAGTVSFKATLTRIGRGPVRKGRMSVKSITGEQLAMLPNIEALNAGEHELGFAVNCPGFYLFHVESGDHGFKFVEGSVPLALVSDEGCRACGLNGDAEFYLRLPESTSYGAVMVTGGGGVERVRARLTDPAARCVWEADNVGSSQGKVVKRPAAGIWKLEIGKPSQYGYDDYTVDVFGMPTFFFLSPEKTWECRPVMSPAVTVGWEDVAEPAREAQQTAVVWRFAELKAGDWSVEKRHGAVGAVEIRDGIIKVHKTNDAGEIVIKAKPFAAEKGRELAFAADVEVDGTDWSLAKGMLRAHGEQESFAVCKLDEQDGRWGNRCIMWDLPNSMPGQTYRKFAQHISEGRVTPVIVISGAPSKSVWHNWLAEDRQQQRKSWCADRDRRNLKNRFAETMADEAAFDAALAADSDHVATVRRIDGYSTMLVDGKPAVPMIYRGKHSLLGTSQTELFFGRQLQDQGLKLQIVDVRFGPCGGDMGFWTKDGFDLAGMVKDIKDAMRVSSDSLFMLALGCTVYPEFVEVENPDEVWLTKEGVKAIGHGSSAIKYTDRSINAGNRKWEWPSMSSRKYRDGICARIRELVRELKRQGLTKRIVGIHTFGYHDAQFTVALSDHSKPAKAEYLRFIAEAGHASTNYEFFVRQLGFRAQEEFARTFRDELGKEILAAMWWESPLRGRPASSWNLGSFLRSDVMNVIVAQPWYEHRNPATIGGSHPPFASMHLHGKLFWDEYDLRTHEIIEKFRQGPAGVPGGGMSADLTMWRTMFRKLAGVAIANDMGCWFYEKAGGGFSTPAVSADIGEEYRLWQQVIQLPRRQWHPSVAIVADEAGVWGWPEGEDFDWARVEKSYFDQLPILEASGAPFDIYLLEDVLRDPSLLKDYRLALFAHLRKVDAPRAAMLAQLGKTKMQMAFLGGAGELGGREALPCEPMTPGALSAAEFNRMVRAAGGYAAMEPNAAQVEINGRFASVHALKNGAFDFQLPFAAKVRNLKSGRLELVNGGRLRLNLTAGETCYFAFTN